MENELITLREAAAMLGVKPHVVVYALTSGKAKEPIWISGRRMFSHTDVEALRQAFRQKRRGRYGQ